MPYDPRMLQMAQMGLGMMAPPPSPFERNAPKPKQWWEQPLPRGQLGAPADDPSKPDDPNAPKKPQPSLLQMLMLGGQPTYSGTPTGGAAPSGGYSPWGWPGGGGGYGR